MDYKVSEDLVAIREILGITQADLANDIGVEQVTISRTESGKTKASAYLLEKVYTYAFEKSIKLGKVKEMLWRETIDPNHKLLFHGAKSSIDGVIDVHKGRMNNDLGQGFYAGESYNQAVVFVTGYEHASIYYLDFTPSDLKCKRYNVNQDWMLTIAYYRGKLDQYKEHPLIRKLIDDSRDCDYIIAPIADNRMFQIINSFIDGEITDEQCKHCLAATNLGCQYVFVSDKAANSLRIVERTFVSDNEKEYYKKVRTSDSKLGEDKVKLARIKYRGQGLYIDEILC